MKNTGLPLCGLVSAGGRNGSAPRAQHGGTSCNLGCMFGPSLKQWVPATVVEVVVVVMMVTVAVAGEVVAVMVVMEVVGIVVVVVVVHWLGWWMW